jgi:pilus assembly protein CpaB
MKPAPIIVPVVALGAGGVAAMLASGSRKPEPPKGPPPPPPLATGVGGFILPNDHVDVVLTRRDKAAEKLTGVEKYVSERILRNVRVLAIDQSTVH